MNEYLAFLIGIAAAAMGGELFVRGAVGLARWWRIPPGIIGATVAAFATSSPELSVSISSALAGSPQIALGDALGSNVVNVALVLALVLLMGSIRSQRDAIRRDFSVGLLVPVLTGVLFLDGSISRIDGVLLLCLFLGWMVATVIEVRKQRSAAGNVLGEQRGWRVIAECIAGLILLIIAGNLIVAGARGVALKFGIDEFVIGATVVAIGTSVPELATAVIARMRGHDEVGLGAILGSNIFNGAFIVAIAALIHPIYVDWRDVTAALGCGVVALVLAYPSANGWIERRRGAALLFLYVVYTSVMIQL